MVGSYVSTSGKDANDGLTLDTPLRTLEHATEIAKPGSTIFVRGGTYDGFVVSDGEFGTTTQWVLMKPYEKEEVTVHSTGTGPTIYFYSDSCDEDKNLVNGDCDKAYWRLEGLHIQGSPKGGGDGNGIKIDTPQVQIVGNKLCTDTDELGMTDWLTLHLQDNVYFVEGGAPVFSLKATSLQGGGDFKAFQAALKGLTGQSDASKVADPLFADPKLFELQAASPAIDAMDCLVTFDKIGTARPQGARCDIGASEKK
jgi:hypothetical protein